MSVSLSVSGFSLVGPEIDRASVNVKELVVLLKVTAVEGVARVDVIEDADRPAREVPSTALTLELYF